jgi:hypothetical protein
MPKQCARSKLKDFNVIVTRDCTESCYVRVKAENIQEAESLALDRANDSSETLHWETDDGIDRAYIADPGNCAHEVEEKDD